MRPRARRWTETIGEALFENGSYKLVALFVTLILWVTILGRRDFRVEKAVDLEIVLPPGLSIKEREIPRQVIVRVAGTRMALRRFSQTPDVVTIDLSRAQAGLVRQTMTPKLIDAPFGVKVESVTPEFLQLTLVRSAEGASGGP
jgi:hypothetical protein